MYIKQCYKVKCCYRRKVRKKSAMELLKNQLYIKISYLKYGRQTMIRLFVVIAVVIIILKIVYWLAQKDIKNKMMRCPYCYSSQIIPETDALWSCANCKALFSANSIQ